MGLRVHLVRHGETACSVAGRLCGCACDVDLTAAGQATAAEVARHFADHGLAGIYSSNLARARSTALVVAQRSSLPVQEDADWREIHYGAWEGILLAQPPASERTALAAWHTDPLASQPPQGEHIEDVRARARAALQRLRAIHRDGEVLVVSHKTTLRVLLCDLLGIPLSDYRRRLAQPEGCVSTVDLFEDGAQLQRLGAVPR